MQKSRKHHINGVTFIIESHFDDKEENIVSKIIKLVRSQAKQMNDSHLDSQQALNYDKINL